MATVGERGRDIILHGQSLRSALISLSKLAEEELPGGHAGYTLVDPTGSFINEAVFPSLPAMFEQSIISILVTKPAGTCVEAFRTGNSVISNDILGDARFEPLWRDLCLRCGLKSVQSIPLRRMPGATEGTFVLGYKDPATDVRWNTAVMEEFAALAYEAVQLYRTLSVKS